MDQPTEEKYIVELSKAAVYQKKHLILNNVNLKVKEKEFIYLIGKTGSGKSSLLKTLYGELPLLTGKGTVADIDLHTLPWKKVPYLRRKLGIIFQDFNLLTDRSVEENLMFVLKATGWKDQKKMTFRVNDVLERVGLKTKGTSMPYQLSGGEQQRVVIARALLNTPQLILADEPTGNLDPETSHSIISLLRELAEESSTAVIMATHDYYILETFPGKMVRCQDGRILDQENIEV
ncbi:MAG: ATP-binding cassette domain-containing protein [Bacteroidota bacterium]